MTTAERLGANIRELRLAKGLTQEKLAEDVAGIDGPRISKLENGTENPTLATLSSLAQTLGADMARLFLPRPEEQGESDEGASGRSVGGRARLDRVLEPWLSIADEQFPVAETWQGDVHQAIASLTRALRRDAAAPAPGAPTGTTGPRAAGDR